MSVLIEVDVDSFPQQLSGLEAVYLASRHPRVISMSLNISGTDRVSGSYQRRDSGDSNTKQEKPCDDGIIEIEHPGSLFIRRSISSRTQMEQRQIVLP